MRYRALDASGDMTFGGRRAAFLVDSPDVVAQALKTRLLLLTGEWFLDVTEGTPYAEQILGNNTSGTYDRAIRERVLETPGVLQISAYTSVLQNRQLRVSATIDTLYGILEMRLRGFAPSGSSSNAPAAIIDFSNPDNSGLLPTI